MNSLFLCMQKYFAQINIHDKYIETANSMVLLSSGMNQECCLLIFFFYCCDMDDNVGLFFVFRCRNCTSDRLSKLQPVCPYPDPEKKKQKDLSGEDDR